MTNLRTSFSRAALKLSTAFIVIGAIVSGAAAQNLIQNSGFDVGPPTACGNNLPNPTGWPIPPWNVTGASKSNVVVVDDNVSCLYGNLGPQKDASAPGSGIKQYYLDIANGQNKFYQSFTVPSCSSAPDGSTATVTFGGYFSSRENLVGTGTIWLHQGVGDTGTIIATLPVTIPAGPSQTTPWTHVTGTASVVRGATFSYVVFMDNNVNFDNAHLTIDADACNPPPPPPPPPPVTQCLDAKGDVTCNPDGTVSVTITATNFSGSDITVTSLTPGVTVTTPQQPWAATTTWTLAGATPGQTVKLSVNGTKTGGGSAPGTDQCCGTEITVVIPACQQPPPPPLGELIVVKKVVYNGPLVMPSLTYPVTVTCGTWNKTFNLIHNVPQSEGNVPQASCSAAEALPPAPAGACDPNKTATWQTPVVAQATSGITTTITVTNTLDCLPNENGQLGSLTIKKMVVNNTSPQISTNGIVFPISVSCQSGMSPAVVTPMPLNDQGSQTINGLAFGTSCQVTEGSPGPFPPQPFLCMNNMAPTWTKNFVSSGTVSISGAHTVTVQNILDCKPEGGGHGDPNKGYMRVEKTIQNDANASLGALQALTFPVTVTCDGNATPVSVKLTQAGVVTGKPVTTTCTALEGAMPPPPAGSCPSGQVPAWMPPETYTPASVTISSGAGPVITIKNTLACRPEGGGSIGTPPPLPPPPPPSVKCKAPLIAEGKACVCPAGTRKRGSTCVKPVVCHAPATLNKNGTACVCPRGMVRKGSTCVRKEQPKQDGPRITPNDVIRVVPGIIGPGFGGGGDRKGGGGGDRKGGGGSGAGGPAGVR
jgi:hypothetical protein